MKYDRWENPPVSAVLLFLIHHSLVSYRQLLALHHPAVQQWMYTVSHAQVLKERCKDSKKHYVDFSVASNNCSYKTKRDSCEHGSKTRGKVLKTHEPSLTNISPVKMGHFHLGLENNLKYSNSRLQLTQAVTHWTVLLAFKGPSCAAIYKMV